MKQELTREKAVAASHFNRERDYWLQKLADRPEKTIVPYDGVQRDPSVVSAGFTLPETLFDGLMKLSNRSEVKLYMILTAALTALLDKYNTHSDIIMGMPVLKQDADDDYINTIMPLRVVVTEDMSFKDLLLKTRESIIEASANQNYPIEMLLHQLDLTADAANFPLFDIVPSLQGMHDQKYREQLTPALTVHFHVRDHAMEMQLQYLQSLYNADTIHRTAHHFMQLLHTVIGDVNVPLTDATVLSAEERRYLLTDLNNTALSFPQDRSLAQMFQQQVHKTPDRKAVIFQNECVTYRQLNRRAGVLAQYLTEGRGVLPEDRIGIIMEPSLELPQVILGILKAGAAYVPIEPTMPPERISHMIRDAAIKLVISQRKFLRLLNRLQWECDPLDGYLCIDSDDIHAETESEESKLMDTTLWAYVADAATDDITAGGWFTSYDGAPFSREEMDEYAANVMHKIAPLINARTRVLEIGCASGLTMYPVAAKTAYYHGTDLSAAIIESNRRKVAEQGISNIHLTCLPAHEINTLAEGHFDLVIINSVIQSFPGHNYLRNVVNQCLDRLAPQGHLFIGDVMDQQLKETLVADMISYKETHREEKTPVKTDWSEELFVHRRFFEDLTLHIPALTNVTFSRKIHTIQNELTRYRYDALFSVDKTAAAPAVAVGESPVKPAPRKYQDDRRHLNPYTGTDRATSTGSDGLAYIIYTSGSTGKPRGVAVRQRSVVNLALSQAAAFGVDENERILQFSSIAFDASVEQIFVALFSGAALVLIDKMRLLDQGAFETFLEQQQVTHVHAVPSFIATMTPRAYPHLKRIIAGGDVCPPRLAAQWSRYTNFINEYGPTETTVTAVQYIQQKGDHAPSGAALPIGKPLSNIALLVLDKHMQPVPLGVPGELYIAGACITAGYLNNPEATAEKFIPNPFLQELPPSISTDLPAGASAAMYRTGDYVRRTPDGNLIFIGRKDHQVKIRGYRIELGEIESRLRTHPALKDVLVTLVQSASGDDDERSICAYYTAASDPDAIELRDYLTQRLPDYLIPAHFIHLETMPLTPGRKPDRNALPAPRSLQQDSDYTPPATTEEEKLVSIWAELLEINRENLSVTANFFHLGGHSLKATILVARIRKDFSVEFPLSHVFKHPTIREAAGYIQTQTGGVVDDIMPAPKRDYYPLSSSQKRLFIMSQFENIGTSYNMPDILEINGHLDKERLNRALSGLIQRHETLRTSFHQIDHQPMQQVHRAEDIDFCISESNLPAADICPATIQALIKEFIRPFDLAQAPLLRVHLVTVQSDRYFLLYDMHHIIGDGTSSGILSDDFASLYEGETLEPLRIQYKDFAYWQDHLLHSGKIKAQEDYWLNIYKDAPNIPRLNLPTDYPRPEIQSFEGSVYNFQLDPETTRLFLQLGKDREATLFMSVMAVLNTLLYKYTGQEDIIIGVGIMGRPKIELQRIIGLFVNGLPIRSRPAGHKTFIHFLEEIKKDAVDAFENQDLSFDQLVSKLDLQRDPSRNPLFDVSIGINNFQQGRQKTSNTTFAAYPSPVDVSRFDMTLYVTEAGEQLLFNLEYSINLFKRNTIQRMAQRMLEIITQVTSNPQSTLNDIQLSSLNEEHNISGDDISDIEFGF